MLFKAEKTTNTGSWSIKPVVSFNAKWMWKGDTNHYLLNNKAGDSWDEYDDGKVKFTYNLLSYSDDNPILFDDSRGVFAKLTESKIIFGFNLDEIQVNVLYVYLNQR